MTLIIAGTRTIQPNEAYGRIAKLWPTVEHNFGTISRVITGMYGGVDMAGKAWAEDNDIPFVPYPADWTRYGRAAGPLRNVEMAKVADCLLLIWNGESPGSRSMYDIANRRGLPILSIVDMGGTIRSRAE